MKRTTLYLEPELEVLLKLEVVKQGRPMAVLVREAIQAYVTREPQKAPPGAGAFASGRADTAARVDETLAETGFAASEVTSPRKRGTPRVVRRRPAPKHATEETQKSHRPKHATGETQKRHRPKHATEETQKKHRRTT